MERWTGILNIEKTDYRYVDGRSFVFPNPAVEPSYNNAALRRVWEALGDISHGTIARGFEDLYVFGGAWCAVYDLEGKYGAVPPKVTIPGLNNEQDLELVLSAFRSVTVPYETRPAILGVWAHQDQLPEAQGFMANFDFLCTRLADSDVYVVMRKPDDTLLASRYDSPRDFRTNYFNVIQRECGQTVEVTNDPQDALTYYQREKVDCELRRIARGETQVPTIVRHLPRFVNRRLLERQIKETYPNIEIALAA